MSRKKKSGTNESRKDKNSREFKTFGEHAILHVTKEQSKFKSTFWQVANSLLQREIIFFTQN